MEETKIEKLEQKVETNENPLGTEKISKLIKRFAIPCIISLVVSSLYNIVDQIFIRTGSWIFRKWCNKYYISFNNNRSCICINVRRWVI